MVLSFKRAEQAEEIEIICNGFYFLDDVCSTKEKVGDTLIKKGAYVLPIEVRDKKVFGFTTIDGKVADFPLRFVHQISFSKKEHYGNDLEGCLSKRTDSFELAIPLLQTTVKTLLFFEKNNGNAKENNLLSPEPFSFIGVSGMYGIHPLAYIFNSGKELLMRSIFMNTEYAGGEKTDLGTLNIDLPDDFKGISFEEVLSQMADFATLRKYEDIVCGRDEDTEKYLH